jgi:pimeloyl-ACP methyl ester carboxylesterase
VGERPDAVAVAHSLTGVMLPLVPARAHVFLCAFVPRPGRPMSERTGDALLPDFGGTVRDDLGRSSWPSQEVAAARLYPGLTPDTVAWAYPQLRSQARRPSLEPSPVGALPRGPLAYVVARDDTCVSPGWGRRVAREELGVEPIELDGGHFPMLERPAELAEVLDRFERSLGAR